MKFLKVTLFIVSILPSFANAGSSYKFVENEITSFMKENNVPAVSVGIIESGKIKFEKAFGTYSRDNLSSITTNSLFQIGSQSKVITSLLTLSLVEDGRLNLNDNLDNLLPKLFQSIDKATLQKITLDILLSHRSGLPNYPTNVNRVDGDPMEGGYTESQLLAAFKSLILDFEPDSKFSYSNFNYAVIGYILSAKTGKSYEALVEEYLDEKFGVSGVYGRLTSKNSDFVVTPYRKDDRLIETKPWDMGLLTPHGGLYSSSNGLLRLMIQQMSAYQNVDEGKQASPFVSTQNSYETGLYPGLNYGYGMFEATAELGLYPETVLWHGGDLDGFGCEYIFSPSSKTGIVLLTSSGGRDFVLLGRKLMQKLLASKANKQSQSDA
ncbi:serine hydrolase domain-containing protein [Shewanella sp. 10N.286.52.B9]|uniref:serine hydrolase domain-containing protein n=1 Tax=Shewanella sp. 10N.286.52.B9 TaxID=1880837 RepID=UPI000CBA7E7C|nr:serine hydrolase domain-containing protein [Shewanella sp. 10N.286.52.B9]PMG48690.1 hypothetical protein BCU91_18720 [Shewanella sp. 10N.286.52.B9]